MRNGSQKPTQFVEDESDSGEGSSSGTPAPKIWRLMGGKNTADELDTMVMKLDPTQQKKDASRERKRRRKQQAKNAEQAEKDRDKPRMRKGMNYAQLAHGS